jgi:hypothetical protein
MGESHHTDAVVQHGIAQRVCEGPDRSQLPSVAHTSPGFEAEWALSA